MHAHSSSSPVRVVETLGDGGVQAPIKADVCSLLGSKLELSAEDLQRHNLIAVRTNVTPKLTYTLRTLLDDDVVVDMEAQLVARAPCTRSTVRWFFKDAHTAPLSFDGNLSGDDEEDWGEGGGDGDGRGSGSSIRDGSYQADAAAVTSVGGEEHCVLPLKEYMRVGTRSGLVLVKSRRDPHLWRRRLLILGGDTLMCFNTATDPPRRRVITLDGHTDILSLASYRGVNNVIVLENAHFRDQGSVVLAAPSATERASWAKALRETSEYRRQNDVIAQAEMLLTDEVYVRLKQAHDRLGPILKGPGVRGLLTGGLETMRRMGTGHPVMNMDIAACYRPLRGGDALDRKFQRRRIWLALRSVCSSPSAVRQVISFVLAVERFKDAFRVDVLIDPLRVWTEALRIHAEHLDLSPSVPGSEGQSQRQLDGGDAAEALQGWPPSVDHVSCVDEAIAMAFDWLDVATTTINAQRHDELNLGVKINSKLLRTRNSVFRAASVDGGGGGSTDSTTTTPTRTPVMEGCRSPASPLPPDAGGGGGGYFGFGYFGTSSAPTVAVSPDRASLEARLSCADRSGPSLVRLELQEKDRVYTALSEVLGRPPLGLFDPLVEAVLAPLRADQSREDDEHGPLDLRWGF